MSGYLIVVEGPDLTGKTTAVKLLEYRFRQITSKVVVLRAMGTGELGYFIREKLLSGLIDDKLQSLACSLAIVDCYNTALKYLDQDYIVIIDRFIASYYAYNLTANQNIGSGEVFSGIMLNKGIIDREPDRYLYIRSPLSLMKQRLESRNERSVIDDKPIEYHRRVRNGFDNFFCQFSHLNVTRIINDSTLEDYKANLESLYNNLLVDFLDKGCSHE